MDMPINCMNDLDLYNNENGNIGQYKKQKL